MLPTAPPRRSAWRFSLRMLFLLVTLAGLLCGFVGRSIAWRRARYNLSVEQAERWAAISFDEQMRHFYATKSIPPAPLSLRLFGEEGVAIVMYIVENKNRANRRGILAELEHAQELFPEAEILGFERTSDDKLMATMFLREGKERPLPVNLRQSQGAAAD